MDNPAIYRFGEKLLTVWNAPDEDDSFEYMVNYDAWVEVILAKDRDRDREIWELR